MKKTLLFMALLASTSIFAQTELIKNGSADEHTSSTSDNADAFDMTPNSDIEDDLGVDIASPYRYDEDDNPNGWYNSSLETYLEGLYNSGGSVEEQPGSTSSGKDGRGVKLYNDNSPVAYDVNKATRRLYQQVVVTDGTEYTVSFDVKSSTAMVASDVYILNEAITTEVGLENGTADSRVVQYVSVSHTDSDWQTVSFTFTASGTLAVFYAKSNGAYSDGKGASPFDVKMETYWDNISMKESATASVKDNEVSDYFNIYPNPANGVLNIQSKSVEVTKVEMYNVTGQRVLVQDGAVSKGLDVSSLSKGIYVLKISSTDNSFSQKIIIE